MAVLIAVEKRNGDLLWCGVQVFLFIVPFYRSNSATSLSIFWHLQVLSIVLFRQEDSESDIHSLGLLQVGIKEILEELALFLSLNVSWMIEEKYFLDTTFPYLLFHSFVPFMLLLKYSCSTVSLFYSFIH